MRLWSLLPAVPAVPLLWFFLDFPRWRRGAVPSGTAHCCPQCGLEVSRANPMVRNVSGHRLGLRAPNRWCQVCERNAEQHLIHRA